MKATMLPNGKMLIPVPLYGSKNSPDEGVMGEGVEEIDRLDPRWSEWEPYLES